MSINVVPLPPNPFPQTLHTALLPKGTELHRIYSTEHDGNAFNPSTAKLNRFSPIFHDGRVIPVLYAASTREAAIYETLFHDAHVKGARTKTLRAKVLEKKRYGGWLTQRPFTMATLHAPDLARFGLTVDQLTATNSAYYTQTARWAEAIHANHMHVDGLEWTSYRAIAARSFVLFGDRAASADLKSSGTETIIAADAALYEEVIQCGERAGVRVHRSTLP